MTPTDHAARVYDLGRFANALKHRKEHKPLVDAIWSALDVNSAQTDLRSAVDAITALKSLNSHKLPEYESHAIALALLSNAIVLYSRATLTQQKARKTFDIRNRLTDKQKIIHQELYDLRNDAIAHFGTGKSYSGPNWVRETALVYVGETGCKVGISSRRFTYDATVVSRIGNQIQVAYDLIEALRIEKATRCGEMFNQAVSGNDELIALLATFSFNPREFLGGTAETTAFYQSLYTGFARQFVKGSEQHGEWLPPR